jgi:hypothetical protein
MKNQISCIVINGIEYKMTLAVSDMDGMYKYILTPTTFPSMREVIYIKPNREAHLFKNQWIDLRNISYHFRIK